MELRFSYSNIKFWYAGKKMIQGVQYAQKLSCRI